MKLFSGFEDPTPSLTIGATETFVRRRSPHWLDEILAAFTAFAAVFLTSDDLNLLLTGNPSSPYQHDWYLACTIGCVIFDIFATRYVLSIILPYEVEVSPVGITASQFGRTKHIPWHEVRSITLKPRLGPKLRLAGLATIIKGRRASFGLAPAFGINTEELASFLLAYRNEVVAEQESAPPITLTTPFPSSAPNAPTQKTRSRRIT